MRLRPLAIAAVAAVCGACGAWEQQAPTPTSTCPEPDLAPLVEHLRTGGLSALSETLTQHTLEARKALAFALKSAGALPPPRVQDTPAEPVPLELTDDALQLAHSALHSLSRDAAGAPTPATAQGLGSALRCIDADALRAVGTMVRDPRATQVLSQLARAVLRPQQDKRDELAATGLDAPATLRALIGTLLKSLADPEFAPATLLSLLDGLGGPDDGLVKSLAAALRLAITAPDGEVAPTRRAALATLVGCALSGAPAGGLEEAVGALLVETDAPPADSREASEVAATDLAAVATGVEALAGDAEALAATRTLLNHTFAKERAWLVIDQLRAFVAPPLAAAWRQLAADLAAASTCGDAP